MSTSVKSHSSTQVTGGTSWCARAMCSAMSRRTPRSGSRRPSCDLGATAGGAHVVLRDAAARPAARDRAEVDSELLRDSANERCRPHLGRGLARRCRLLRRSLFRARLLHVCRRGAVLADHDQHGPDRHDLALGHEDARDLPGRRRRNLDRRLVGLHLDERVVLGDLLALGDEPARDLALGQALAEIGELELVRHQLKRKASSGSTAWTPSTWFATCVTRRSTTRLASACASSRSKECSRCMRSSIPSSAIARRLAELRIEAECQPGARRPGNRPLQLEVVAEIERELSRSRTLDRGAAHLAVCLKRVPVAGGEQRAVNRDGKEERRPGDKLLAVDVPSPRAGRERRMLAGLGRGHSHHSEEGAQLDLDPVRPSRPPVELPRRSRAPPAGA